MSNAAVSAWKACVEKLEELAAFNSAPPPGSVEQAAVRILWLSKRPPLPASAWRRLIEQFRVSVGPVMWCTLEPGTAAWLVAHRVGGWVGFNGTTCSQLLFHTGNMLGKACLSLTGSGCQGRGDC